MGLLALTCSCRAASACGGIPRATIAFLTASRPHAFEQYIRPLDFQFWICLLLLVINVAPQAEHDITISEVAGIDPPSGCQERMIRRCVDGRPAGRDGHYAGWCRVAEDADDSTPHRAACALVEGGHGVTNANRLNRPPVHERAGRETLVDDEQVGARQPLPPACGAPRQQGVAAGDLERGGGVPNDPRGVRQVRHHHAVADAEVGAALGNLLDEPPAVRQEQHAAAPDRRPPRHLGGDGSLAGARRGNEDDARLPAPPIGGHPVHGAELVVAANNHAASPYCVRFS